jgi:hypothetical protein
VDCEWLPRGCVLAGRGGGAGTTTAARFTTEAICSNPMLTWSYTFPYVPCNPFIKSLQWWPASIRSYTFRATLPVNYANHVPNPYVPIRSVQPSRWIVPIMSWIYTFLYVPCNPPAIIQKCYTFLYVPIKFLYVPPCFLKNLFQSYTFLYVPCNPLAILSKCYTFLYVPIKFLYVPPVFFKEFVEMLYVPIRPEWQLCKNNPDNKIGAFS